MTSLVLDPPERRLRNDRDARLARLRSLPHPPEARVGIPWFDEEFQMAASDAHRKTIYFLGALLDRVAERAGLRGVSDYPIWYWLPDRGEQRALYPDYALTANKVFHKITPLV